MGKILVVAEKPSAASDMASVLNCTTKKNGYFESEKYIITWALGHLIEQKFPQDHDPKYKSWNLNDLPFNFSLSSSLKVSESTAAQFNVIKSLIHRADVDLLINAGDAGREGLLIQEWIYRMAGNTLPKKLLWADSLTHEKLAYCFSHLKDYSKEFQLLLDEAEARAQGDYLYGINLSRLFTLTRAKGAVIRFGRCQTTLLNLIVMRDREIENFKPTDFYTVNVKSIYDDNPFTMSVVDENCTKIQFTEQSIAQAFSNNLTGKNITIKSCSKELKKKKAPLLYNLAKIQQDMGAKYGFTPDKTLEICQKLYETHKILSYPRTDSRYLTTDLFNEIQEHINSINFGEFSSKISMINGITLDKSYFNDGKVTDHHALIPTINKNTVSEYTKLTDDEKKVFDAIANSFIAIFCPEYQYESTVIQGICENQNLLAKGIIPKVPGWKAVVSYVEADPDDTEQGNILPNIPNGSSIPVISTDIDKGKTKSPAKINAASIIKLMEKYNIGTSATRAGIIDSLQDKRFRKNIYIEYNGKNYSSTKLGRDIIDIIPEELKDVSFTQKFEDNLEKINEGIITKTDFLNDINSQIANYIQIFSNPSTNNATVISNEVEYICTCPKCKKGKIRQNPKGYGCNLYKEGCNFFVGSEIAHKKISSANIKSLCEKKRTALIKGFKSATGKSFDAHLILKNDFSIGFEFEKGKK